MTERVRSRTGAPTRWAGPVPDADPTGGRHVLDQDAALTPIFTTLRRGAWRRPRSQPGWALRPVPDPVEQFHRDPLTAPIPVVPASFGPVPPAAPPSVSPTETTTWWGLPVVAVHGGPADGSVRDHAVYAAAPYDSGSYAAAPYDSGSYAAAPYDSGSYAAAPYDSGSYAAAPYDSGSYDSGSYDDDSYEDGSYDHASYDSGSYVAAPYDSGSYDSGSYDRAPHVPAPYDQAAYDPPLYGPPPVHGPVPYQPAAYDPGPYAAVHHLPRREPRPHDYDPLNDTGRHHRRLAPAGW